MLAARLLTEHDLKASASLGLTDATDLTSEDPAAAAAGERMLTECLDIVAAMGGTRLCGVIYSAMKKYMEPATPEGRAASAAALGRLASRADGLGIHLSLEVVNRYETNLINTGRQALEFLDEIDHPNVSVHLDSYHMNIEESDLFSPVLDVGARLGYVHIGESHRGYLGSGTVDFDSLFRGLARISYDGPIVFESFSSAVVHPISAALSASGGTSGRTPTILPPTRTPSSAISCARWNRSGCTEAAPLSGRPGLCARSRSRRCASRRYG